MDVVPPPEVQVDKELAPPSSRSFSRALLAPSSSCRITALPFTAHLLKPSVSPKTTSTYQQEGAGDISVSTSPLPTPEKLSVALPAPPTPVPSLSDPPPLPPSNAPPPAAEAPAAPAPSATTSFFAFTQSPSKKVLAPAPPPEVPLIDLQQSDPLPAPTPNLASASTPALRAAPPAPLVTFATPTVSASGHGGGSQSGAASPRVSGAVTPATRSTLWNQNPAAQEAKTSFRRTFNLPDDEVFLDDFMCALQSRFLIQGKIYVFSQHVCFYSSVFGYTKTLVIPLSEVRDVLKERAMGIPNSMSVVLEDGTKEFFTSFISRDDAYKVILSAWSVCRPDAAHAAKGDEINDLIIAAANAAAAGAAGGAALMGSSLPTLDSILSVPAASAAGLKEAAWSVSHRIMSLFPNLDGPSQSGAGAELDPTPADALLDSGVVVGSGFSDTASTAGTGPGLIAPTGASVTNPAAAADGPLARSPSARSISFQEGSFRGRSGAASSSPAPPNILVAQAGRQGAAPRASPPPALDVTGTPGGAAGAAGDGAGADGGSAAGGAQSGATPLRTGSHTGGGWDPLDRQAPPPPSDASMVFEHVFQCSAKAFLYRIVFAYEDFQKTLGADQFDMRQWAPHPTLGYVRDFHFRSKIRSRVMVGYTHTRCLQSQRYQVYRGEGPGLFALVFETSQVMQDIPYGDIFKVETRWMVTDVTAAEGRGGGLGSPTAGAKPGGASPGPTCKLCCYLTIPFSKRCMFKSVIMSQTTDEVKDFFESNRRLMVSKVRPTHTTRHIGRSSLGPLAAALASGDVASAGGAAAEQGGAAVLRQESSRGLMGSIGRGGGLNLGSILGDLGEDAALQGGNLDAGDLGAVAEAPKTLAGRALVAAQDAADMAWTAGLSLKTWALDTLSDVIAEITRFKPRERLLLVLCILLGIHALIMAKTLYVSGRQQQAVADRIDAALQNFSASQNEMRKILEQMQVASMERQIQAQQEAIAALSAAVAKGTGGGGQGGEGMCLH